MVTKRDEIPALNYPKFISGAAAKKEYYEHEPVTSMGINGVSKAYPLSVLAYFELCNDSIGCESVMVTFCPMCNAAMVFNRRVKHKGQEMVLNFGVSGILMHNDMVMYDRQTESWWQQLTGEAIAGEMAGTDLKMMRAMIISAKDYFDRYPDGQILSPSLKVKMAKKEHRLFHHLEHNREQLPEGRRNTICLKKRITDFRPRSGYSIFMSTITSKYTRFLNWLKKKSLMMYSMECPSSYFITTKPFLL